MSTAHEHMAQRLAFGTADRLNKALTVAGISSNEMADYLGVGRNTISNYINGRTRPRKATIRDWARRTGVPCEWLETGHISPDGPNGGGQNTGRPQTQEFRISGVIQHLSQHGTSHKAA